MCDGVVTPTPMDHSYYSYISAVRCPAAGDVCNGASRPVKAPKKKPASGDKKPERAPAAEANSSFKEPLMDLTAISSKTTFRELNIRGHFDGSADRASLPGCLSLDAELYRKENPDQDTPASSMQILEDNLELCVEAMLRFWQGPGEERGIQPFHLALHPPVYTCDQAPTFVSHLFGSDKFCRRRGFVGLRGILALQR